MTTMKRLAMAVLTAGLLGSLTAGVAWADKDLTNDKASLTIRITPNVDYGVTLDTATLRGDDAAIINLGSVELYASTQTVKPATATIVGTVSKGAANTGQELDVLATNLTAGGWSFDATPSTYSTLGSINELAMYLAFTPTSQSVKPTGDEFANALYEYTGGSVHAGQTGGNGTKFEMSAVDMDDLSVGNKAHLWLLFRLPNETSTGAAQDIQVTLTAGAAS